MKRIWLFTILALSLSLFNTSCSDDPVGPTTPVNEPPLLTFLDENPTNGNGSPFVYQDVTFLADNPELSIYMGISGMDSVGNMRDLLITRNGDTVGVVVSLTADDMTDLGSNNPALITGDYDTSFNWEVVLKTGTEYGANEFVVTLTDEDGESVTDTAVVTVEQSMTDISLDYEDRLLFNASGQFNGGFDLDTGNNVSSSSTESELQDDGIDLSLPMETSWLRSITPENGAVMRRVNTSSLPEGFTFDDVESKEIILDIWNSGSEVIGSTGEITEGEMFTVFANEKYFIILFKQVNNNPSNNSDNYIMDIKQ